MGLTPPRRPGWLLEGGGDTAPRGMVAHPAFGVRPERRWTEPGLQTLWHFHLIGRAVPDGAGLKAPHVNRSHLTPVQAELVEAHSSSFRPKKRKTLRQAQGKRSDLTRDALDFVRRIKMRR